MGLKPYETYTESSHPNAAGHVGIRIEGEQHQRQTAYRQTLDVVGDYFLAERCEDVEFAIAVNVANRHATAVNGEIAPDGANTAS